MATKENMDKRLGLIGKNIAYSFSRKYFSEKFERENIVGYHYENFDLSQADLIPELLSNTAIVGCNVTIPYKETIIPFLSDLSPEARAIGAVNTVVFDQSHRAIGHNTDCYGFERALSEAFDFEPKKALILGTGGAAKAIKYVMDQKGILHTTVSRNPSNQQIAYHQLDAQTLDEHLLIINCTPLGTYPNITDCPDIPYHFLTARHGLFDLIYNPSETLFLQKGKNQGAQISNGLKMLEYQAEKAWELWQEV
jgi:shikimate dehydrogenase